MRGSSVFLGVGKDRKQTHTWREWHTRRAMCHRPKWTTPDRRMSILDPAGGNETRIIVSFQGRPFCPLVFSVVRFRPWSPPPLQAVFAPINEPAFYCFFSAAKPRRWNEKTLSSSSSSFEIKWAFLQDIIQWNKVVLWFLLPERNGWEKKLGWEV